jgi:hypothetical protein
MISSIGSGIPQGLMTPDVRQRAEKPSQLPAQSPASSDVSLSDEAKRLAAARVVTSNPVAVAAVSDNPRVDQVATNVYMGQQAQRMLDTYTEVSRPPEDSSGTAGSQRSPVAIAAASQNPEVDELATTAYKSKQAQQMIDMYTESYQSATQGSTVEESA